MCYGSVSLQDARHGSEWWEDQIRICIPGNGGIGRNAKQSNIPPRIPFRWLHFHRLENIKPCFPNWPFVVLQLLQLLNWTCCCWCPERFEKMTPTTRTQIWNLDHTTSYRTWTRARTRAIRQPYEREFNCSTVSLQSRDWAKTGTYVLCIYRISLKLELIPDSLQRKFSL